MDLICISTIITDAKHASICLLALGLPTFREVPTQVVCSFITWLAFVVVLQEFLIHSGY